MFVEDSSTELQLKHKQSYGTQPARQVLSVCLSQTATAERFFNMDGLLDPSNFPRVLLGRRCTLFASWRETGCVSRP